MRSMLVLLACAVSWLSGCSSLHLYNKSNEDTAAAAKSDFEGSKLGERIASQRAVLHALEERDVVTFVKLEMAERDQALLALIAGSELSGDSFPTASRTTLTGFPVRLLARLEARMTVLDGDPKQRVSVLEQREIRTAERAAARQAQRFDRIAIEKMLSVTLPVCDDRMTALAADQNGEALGRLIAAPARERIAPLWPRLRAHANNLGTRCSQELAAAAALTKLPYGGLLATVTAHRDRQRAIFQKSEQDAKAQRTTLKLAAGALATASKQVAQSSKIKDLSCPDPQQPGQDAEPPERTKLCTALKNLKGLGSIGEKIVSEEKLARIGQVLQALSGVEPAAQEGDVNSALALLAATTRLRHGLYHYQFAGKWPSLEVLIIERQLAEAQLASADARLALDAARLGYHDAQVAALEEELQTLGHARTVLAGGFGGMAALREASAGLPCTRRNTRMCGTFESYLRSQDVSEGVPPERQAYRALALFAESYSGPRARYREASVRLALSGYNESLIRSEEGLASWKALLDTPVDLLRQYHAGGIKPEHIAPLLQTLGIFAIADGVN